jgi:proline dehydrogenase
MAKKRARRRSKVSPSVKSSILQAIRENMERLENLATILSVDELGKDVYTKGDGGDQYSKSDKETYSKGPGGDNYTKSDITIGDFVNPVVNPVDMMRAIEKAGQE